MEDYQIQAVKELIELLEAHDDFDMKYNDLDNTIETTLDEDTEIATITLNGEAVCDYSYSGFGAFPTACDEMLLDEALTVIKC